MNTKNIIEQTIGSITKMVTIFVSLTLMHASIPISAQGYLKADGKRIVNERGENVLLRGMGFGGWMLQEGYMFKFSGPGQQHVIKQKITEVIGKENTNRFYNEWLANYARKVDIDSMKAWGFNNVRLPMHYNLYTLPIEEEPVTGQNTWLEKGFAMTDSLLGWCKANNMYLILDLHAAPGGQGTDLNISDRDTSKPSLWASEANRQKTVALWKKLAARYVNEPWIGGYDLINEPNFGFTDLANDPNGTKEGSNAPLKQLYLDIVKAIREVDTKHLIIIEGNGWGNNYNGMLPPFDNNMVLSFHKYWNFNNTKSIENILKTRDQYNVPVWLGETGENSNTWFTEAIRLFEQNNIGWAWWPLKKMGHNNPLQIKIPAGYNNLLQYWQQGGPKPTMENAVDAMMQVAANARIENNIYHKDVVDAMMRQPHTNATLPFKANKIVDGSVVAAVDYDLGPNGFAYYDTDTADYWTAGKPGIGNRGRMYRNDGVDIQLLPGADAYGPAYHSEQIFYVDNIETNEWMQYTINVANKGLYNLQVYAGSDTTGGQIAMQVNGKTIGKTVAVPPTNGATKFVSLSFKNVALPKGKSVVRVYAQNGGFTLSRLTFAQAKQATK